ncbi:hypothetical protein T12_6379 [Trichinella patagoniensis]|uniref:Uncharacterized protein n=1 Tax=Trichinella patagoniensis TaxID=990121 RepID=A0A0V0Z4J4_9BILA|nr:hypothetical protein T12_6379 [Trichinella patagoniensis]
MCTLRHTRPFTHVEWSESRFIIISIPNSLVYHPYLIILCQNITTNTNMFHLKPLPLDQNSEK